MHALPSNKNARIPQIFKFTITKLCIKIKEIDMSEDWFVYAVLFKHYKANILGFLLKLCKCECRLGKLQDFRHVKILINSEIKLPQHL